MAKKEPKSLFRRLSRLFKTGPVVKRKIRGLDTTMTVADKSKSSGTLLFQKSLSPTYATITSNAYNLSERLMRYQDFCEMEYTPEIAAALDIYCLTEESIISTPYGDKTIKELYDLNGDMTSVSTGCSNLPVGKFPVYCYDNDKKCITIGLAHSVRKTGSQVPVIKVTFDNGRSIRCTPNHRFMLRNGTYMPAVELVPGTSLMPFTMTLMGLKGHEYRYVYTMDRSKTKSGWRAQHLFNVEHLVRELNDDEVVHHIDFNRENNAIDNLVIMGRFEHSSYHAKINNRNKLGVSNKKHAEWMMKNNPTRIDTPSEEDLWAHVEKPMNIVSAMFGATYSVLQEWVRKLGYENWTAFKLRNKSASAQHMKRLTSSLTLDEIKRTYVVGDTKAQLVMKLGCTVNVFDKFLNRKLGTSWSALVSSLGGAAHTSGGRPKGSYGSNVSYQDICDSVIPGQYVTKEQLSKKLGVNTDVVLTRLKARGFETFSSWSDSYHNHKVVSVESDGVADVYDLTTDVHHNFACNGVIVHNSDETVSADEKGRSLHIFSDNEKIKEILEDLFYNILNTEFNLRSWTRNLPIRDTTPIPLLDGTTLTIKGLAEKMKAEPNWVPWVYSVQDKTLKMVPGKVIWCDKTRENSELIRVWLDDETYVDCTSDHEWVLRDGTSKRADELIEGDSLMPLYREISTKTDRICGYEKVYDPSNDLFEYTHRVVEKGYQICVGQGGKNVVHHVDFNKRNNTPDNLIWMGWSDHHDLHADIGRSLLYTPEAIAKKNASLAIFNKTERFKANQLKKSEQMKQYWQDTTNVEAAKERLIVRFDNRCLDYVMSVVGSVGKGMYVGTQALCQALHGDEQFIKLVRSANPRSGRDLKKILNKGMISTLVSRAAKAPYHVEVARRFPKALDDPGFSRARMAYEKRQAKEHCDNGLTRIPGHMNHKVSRVERLSEISDVYCMEVVGPGGEHDRHNFAVLGLQNNGTVSPSGVILRNCKYGDLFLYNDVSPTHGVVNAFPIPVNEIEREENYDKDDPFAVRFRWVTLGNRTLENWEVTHFRLLGNDMFLPYGSSIIEPARRIWRQLILIEDAMLVYRVVRAPERRVFYIDVANVPPENVPMYVEEQRKNLRTNQVVDRTSGRVDLRYNPMPMRQNTLVPLLDGRTLELHELADEYAKGKNNWVYAIQKDTLKVVPGKVVWCGKNYSCDKIHRVWLDDGSYLDAAPEHPFVMRDGSSKRADELLSGDSLMPLYKKLSSKLEGDHIEGYEKIYDPCTDKYVLTHRQTFVDVAGFDAIKGKVIHHVDYNKRNNAPTNLCAMTWFEHYNLHCKLVTERNKSLVGRVASSNRMKRTWAEGNISNKTFVKLWKDDEVRNKRVSALTLNIGDQNVFLEHCLRIMDVLGKGLSVRELEFIDAANNDKDLQTYLGLNNPKFKNGHIGKFTHGNLQIFMRKAGLTKSLESLKRSWLMSRYDIDDIKKFCVEKQNCRRKDVLEKFKLNRSSFEEFVKLSGCDLVEFREKYLHAKHRSGCHVLNHKVDRVEILNDVDDVYCLTVHGPNGEHDRHTVAVQGRGGEQGIVFVFQSVDEDYFIPVRGGDSGTKIDTLAGGQNTAAVEDVAYIQKKLFAALKIPRAYLGYDDMLSCLRGDTQIPLLDGTSIRIDELAQKDWSDERKQGQSTWTYSCDPASGEIKPGKVTKAWKTKEVDVLYRVNIDDGGTVECTGNHPFLCRDGIYRRADELVSGQSLMPVYKRTSVSRKHGGTDEINGYEMILNNSTNEWEYTHRVVSKNFVINDYVSRKDERSYVLHHVDHNKLNNNPLNLIKMGKKAHALYHSTGAQANLLSESSRDKLRDVMSTDEYRSVHLKGVQQAWETNYVQRKSAVAISNAAHKRVNVSISTFEALADKACNRKEFAGILCDAGLSWQIFRSNLSRANINISDWLCERFKGRPRGRKPKSNVTIDQVRDFCVKHNITNITEWRRAPGAPVCGGVVRRILVEAGFDSFGDFKSTIPYNHKVSSVEVIHLNEPIPVFDLEVEHFHNFAICTDPVGTSGIGNFIVVHNSKATLAQEDIRFSRTINVIQKTILAELNKLAIIHLYAHGYSGEDLQNFTLRLSNPSTVAQQQKLELWRSKFEIGGSLPEGMGSATFVQREIWGLSDEQINDINDQRMEEKLFNARVEASATATAEGGMGDGEDLFGGGGETGGAPPDEPTTAGGSEETPPPETAGEEPEEEEEPGIELLTSSDDLTNDEEFDLRLSSENDGPVVQVRPQLKKTLYNRSRRRTHGASKTHIPDFRKMTSNDSQSMKDPYDNDWIKSVVTNPLNDSVTPRRQSSVFGGLTPDVWSTLGKMSTSLKLSNKIQGSILVEGNDVQDEIDAKIPGPMNESIDFGDDDNE